MKSFKPDSLKIFHQGRELPGGPRESGGLWYYDFDRNAVFFYDLEFAIGEDEEVDIQFETEDGLPRGGDDLEQASLAVGPGVRLDSGAYEFEILNESPHPYPVKGAVFPPIRIRGAKTLSLFFSQIMTERTYDFLVLKDKTGRLSSEWTGPHTEVWTPEVSGDEIHLSMRTDSSGDEWGYQATKVRATF